MTWNVELTYGFTRGGKIATATNAETVEAILKKFKDAGMDDYISLEYENKYGLTIAKVCFEWRLEKEEDALKILRDKNMATFTGIKFKWTEWPPKNEAEVK